MADVVNIETYLEDIDSKDSRELSALDSDAFLLEEGLDLIAAYRSINDRGTRLILLKFIKDLAELRSKP